MSKLENPVRLAELQPVHTLTYIGLKEGDVFCDIGAGTGIFTVEAAKITKATTYAVDTSDDMLKAIDDKAKSFRLDNIELINPDGFSYPIEDSKCDCVFMCTVLHEIDEKEALFNEINRILKSGGILAVIEFHKRRTPMGPPEQRRISINETKSTAEEYGFTEMNRHELGDNFYICIFKK